MTEKFSASAAPRLMACVGSANLELAIPHWTPPDKDETADNAANRGTAMHELLKNFMQLSRQDRDHLLLALQYIHQLSTQRRWNILLEQTVQAEWLITKPWTTADVVLYLQDELHVIDLKTGKIPVEVIDNKQLLYYALTYLLHYAPDAKKIVLHIVQPAADNMESWEISRKDLHQFANLAMSVEDRIILKDLTLTPNDHCTFCPANPHSRGPKGRPFCPAMMQLLYPQPVVDEATQLKEMLDD